MKERTKGLLAGLLIATLLLPTLTALADSATRSIEAYYNNIKIYIDGAQFTPKDANGNVVEPFVYNGTTYLPVRAVANAFGKDVIWDGETQSVYLGKQGENKPDNYLDRIQYTDYREGNGNNNFWKISGTVTDHLKTDYTSGMLFYVRHDYTGRTFDDNGDNVNSSIDYPLNGQYSKFHGTAVLPQNINIVGSSGNANDRSQTADIYIYGDGRLLQKLTSVTTTMPMNWDVSVKGVNMLTIKIAASGEYTYVALTDLALYK